MKKPPPSGLPIYRILTGVDDANFCRRVSEAVALGYALYGSPAATFNGGSVVVAQALIWPPAEKGHPAVVRGGRRIRARVDRDEERNE